MTNNIFEFLAHWGITALSNKRLLLASALLLGLANAIIRPIVILLTIPLTIFTFGFFLLVINALMMLLVQGNVLRLKQKSSPSLKNLSSTNGDYKMV